MEITLINKSWKIGFVSVLLITSGAFFTHLALKDPALTGEHEAVVTEYKDEHNLDWQWGPAEVECQIYETCLHLEVEGTAKCENQIKIFIYLTDANDDWVDSADTVLQSPGKAQTAVVEVGVNRDDFEYFMVGDVRCTTGVPTVEAAL